MKKWLESYWPIAGAVLAFALIVWVQTVFSADWTRSYDVVLSTDGPKAAITKLENEDIAIYTILNQLKDASAGTSAPASPNEGQIWYDTDDDKFYVYDGASWNRILITISSESEIEGATPTLKFDDTDAGIGDYDIEVDGDAFTVNNYPSGGGTTDVAFRVSPVGGYGYAVWIPGDSSGPGTVFFQEDSDFGEHAIRVAAPTTNIAANRLVRWPDKDGTVVIEEVAGADIGVATIGTLNTSNWSQDTATFNTVTSSAFINTGTTQFDAIGFSLLGGSAQTITTSTWTAMDLGGADFGVGSGYAYNFTTDTLTIDNTLVSVVGAAAAFSGLSATDMFCVEIYDVTDADVHAQNCRASVAGVNDFISVSTFVFSSAPNNTYRARVWHNHGSDVALQYINNGVTPRFWAVRGVSGGP